MATNDLFATIVSDIKTYSGNDPIHPWIRGIRKMKDSLPPKILKEKLPRFLQKCAQAFESDRRYRNDLRYLRVWLQLMDFVDDPRVLLQRMEANCIGTKHALFYQAYALCYEKSKNFDKAEEMYHLGVQNFAEPDHELQKSYEQFLCRLQKHKKRLEKTTNRHQCDGKMPENVSKNEENNENECRDKSRTLREKEGTNKKVQRSRKPCGDDTVVGRFVDTAMIGRSEAENALHHGLVDPTINMKEAMNAINNMFSEPLETAPYGKSRQRRQKNDGNSGSAFGVFVDDDLDKGIKPADANHQEPLSIFVDDLESNKDHVRNSREGSSDFHSKNVFPTPKDHPSENHKNMDVKGSSRPRFREDTVVRRFVGSAISYEPEVENVCHHGLVDPTVNLKEAMEDINNMFGKPIDFVRAKRSKKQEKAPDVKNNFSDGFSILADDDEDNPVKPELKPEPKPVPKPARKSRGCDLFEPTMVTREAIDDINQMFAMPLDF